MPRKTPSHAPEPLSDPTICVRLPQAEIDEVDRRAAAEGRTRSQVIRSAIRALLNAKPGVVR